MLTRQRSRLLAVALIVLTVLGTNPSWHGADDDVDFRTTAVGHDHSAHHEQMRAPGSTTPGEHCAICHWLQSFRSDGPRVARVHFISSASHRPALARPEPVGATIIRNLPPRAPPASTPGRADAAAIQQA